MNYNEALQKRYSVKKFDRSRKVPEETVADILGAGKLSASSQGLQPYRIIVAQSDDALKRLEPAFYNPSQIQTCSHLIAIVAKKNIEDDYISNYFNHITAEREISLDSLSGFRRNIEGFLEKRDLDEVLSWTEKQAYIFLANLMFAAALEKVDTCPMEGFRQDEIEKILEVNTETEKVAVTLALGYRAEDDPFQNLKKVRKPNDRLFKFI